MINRLLIIDFDGTLFSTPMPEKGKAIWKSVKGIDYKHIGWWSKPESLDLNVFDIKPFPKVLSILNKDISTPNTYVIVLTSRMEKLRQEVQNVLDANNINVDKLDLKYNEKTKGQKVLDYLNEFPELTEINVYEGKEGIRRGK